jgi:uncharacterized membrane protein YccF (DUF307 family)
MLKLILNILWLIFGGGIAAALSWLLAGCILFITIIGIPYSYACFRIAYFSALPFGNKLVDARDVGEERIFGTTLVNVIWVILAGIWLFIEHVVVGVGLCLTIIGIPFGLAHFKLAKISFAPLGKRVVSELEL